MKQYCRYCAEAVLTENEDVFFCEAKKLTRSAAGARRINKCDRFKFNPNDLLGQNADGTFKQYKPKTEKDNSDQIKLFEREGE